MEQIKNEVNEIFRKVFKNSNIQISETTTAKDIDGWDSLSHMELISEIESTFKIKFGLKDLSKMSSVGSLITIISSKLS